MHPNSPTDKIAEVAARLERHAETLRRIDELVQEEPELIPLIVAALNGRTSQNPSITCKKREKAKTNFDRVKEFFRDRGNKWATANEITKAIAISRGALGAILHQGHKDDFKKKSKPGSRKTKMWRLKLEGGGLHG